MKNIMESSNHASNKNTTIKWYQPTSAAAIGIAVLVGVILLAFIYMLFDIFVDLEFRNQVVVSNLQYIIEQKPWTLISGLIAAPALLLTWYWREKHKKNTERSYRV